MMGHKYPFTAIHIRVPAEFVDVNVHPAKLELRFADNEAIYHAIYKTVHDALSGKNLIVPVSLSEKEEKEAQKKQILMQQKVSVPEPFEEKRKEIICREVPKTPPVPPVLVKERPADYTAEPQKQPQVKTSVQAVIPVKKEPEQTEKEEIVSKPQQMELPVDLLAKDNKKEFRLIGQLFATYWLIEMEQQLFIIDQHAAHEKVLFERTMQKIKEKTEIITQSLMPPMILSLSMREADCLKQNLPAFEKLGFVIEEFGGLEYKVTEVPADLVAVDSRELLSEVLNTLLSEREYKNADLILEKVASLSCKAAVKGNHTMSEQEAKQLISDMLTLDNPYHCPHGRPTTISMSQYELERKFKRIV